MFPLRGTSFRVLDNSWRLTCPRSFDGLPFLDVSVRSSLLLPCRCSLQSPHIIAAIRWLGNGALVGVPDCHCACIADGTRGMSAWLKSFCMSLGDNCYGYRREEACLWLFFDLNSFVRFACDPNTSSRSCSFTVRDRSKEVSWFESCCSVLVSERFQGAGAWHQTAVSS